MDSEQQAAELYRRLPHGWTREVMQESLKLPCLDVALSLGDMDAGVTL